MDRVTFEADKMKTLIFVGPNVTADVDALVSQHDRSILFEPHIPCWESLRVQYSGREDVKVVLAGCGPEDGMKPFRVYNKNGLSSSFGVCTQQARDVFHGIDLKERYRRLASMVHLGRWLQENGIDEIETLKIDAQGFDFSIIKTVEPLIASGKIKAIQCESDGDDFEHYANTPGNKASDIRRWFSQFPWYREVVMIGFCDFHPDLRFEFDENYFNQSMERMAGGQDVRQFGRDGSDTYSEGVRSCD
jgi:FkbM family methyltransferase